MMSPTLCINSSLTAIDAPNCSVKWPCELILSLPTRLHARVRVPLGRILAFNSARSQSIVPGILSRARATARMRVELFPFHRSDSMVRAKSFFSASGENQVTTLPGKTGVAGTAMLYSIGWASCTSTTIGGVALVVG